MIEIHPTAIVDSNAKIGNGTRIGAYSIIEGDVTIGENCTIHSHAVIRSLSHIGNQVEIHPYCLIGGLPQHLGFKGEQTIVEIHDGVVIREMSTVHRGTDIGIKKTVVHEKAYLMAYSHIAHDCIVGRKTIICSNVQLAGHVEIGECVVVGGQTAIAQFCRLGSYSYIGGGSTLRKDMPPFLLGKGNDFQVQGVNVVGLERNGYDTSAIQKLKKLYKIFYIQKHTVAQAIEVATTELGDNKETKLFVDFIKSSTNGFIR